MNNENQFHLLTARGKAIPTFSCFFFFYSSCSVWRVNKMEQWKQQQKKNSIMTQQYGNIVVIVTSAYTSYVRCGINNLCDEINVLKLNIFFGLDENPNREIVFLRFTCDYENEFIKLIEQMFKADVCFLFHFSLFFFCSYRAQYALS